MIHIADARIDISIWIELEEMGYDELSSSEVDEPISNDSYAFIVNIHFINSIVFSPYFNILFL
jgi:hypothetical protein